MGPTCNKILKKMRKRSWPQIREELLCSYFSLWGQLLINIRRITEKRKMLEIRTRDLHHAKGTVHHHDRCKYMSINGLTLDFVQISLPRHNHADIACSWSRLP